MFLQSANSTLVSISSNSLGYMSNQRSPNEDIQKVSDVEDRLIITTFKEATGWIYYNRYAATLPLTRKKKMRRM